MALWNNKMIAACLQEGASIEVHSPLSPEEIGRILGEQVYPPSRLQGGSLLSIENKSLSRVLGTVQVGGMELMCGPNPRDSLRVIGKVSPTETGSTIELTLKEPDFPVFRMFASVINRYKYDLEFILDWLKSWIQIDDVTEFPDIS